MLQFHGNGKLKRTISEKLIPPKTKQDVTERYLQATDFSEDGKKISEIKANISNRVFKEIVFFNQDGSVNSKIKSVHGGMDKTLYSPDGKPAVRLLGCRYENPDNKTMLIDDVKFSPSQFVEPKTMCIFDSKGSLIQLYDNCLETGETNLSFGKINNGSFEGTLVVPKETALSKINGIDNSMPLIATNDLSFIFDKEGIRVSGAVNKKDAQNILQELEKQYEEIKKYNPIGSEDLESYIEQFKSYVNGLK